MQNHEELGHVILDEADAAQLLRVLYNGPKPARVHTLICICGAIGDLRTSPKAWNGWRILPHPVCPDCLARGTQSYEQKYFPVQAQDRFTQLVEQLTKKDGTHDYVSTYPQPAEICETVSA